MCSWTVLLHNSRIGLAHPELTIHNAFGDSYPHALTPGHPTAAAFARGVIRDLSSRYPLDTIMLEAADYRARAHGGSWVGGHHHERQGTHLRELETALLDVSFNPEDMAGAERAGVDATGLRAAVRAHLDAYLAAAPDVPCRSARLAGVVPPPAPGAGRLRALACGRTRRGCCKSSGRKPSRTACG